MAEKIPTGAFEVSISFTIPSGIDYLNKNSQTYINAYLANKFKYQGPSTKSYFTSTQITGNWSDNVYTAKFGFTGLSNCNYIFSTTSKLSLSGFVTAKPTYTLTNSSAETSLGAENTIFNSGSIIRLETPNITHTVYKSYDFCIPNGTGYTVNSSLNPNTFLTPPTGTSWTSNSVSASTDKSSDEQTVFTFTLQKTVSADASSFADYPTAVTSVAYTSAITLDSDSSYAHVDSSYLTIAKQQNYNKYTVTIPPITWRKYYRIGLNSDGLEIGGYNKNQDQLQDTNGNIWYPLGNGTWYHCFDKAGTSGTVTFDYTTNNISYKKDYYFTSGYDNGSVTLSTFGPSAVDSNYASVTRITSRYFKYSINFSLTHMNYSSNTIDIQYNNSDTLSFEHENSSYVYRSKSQLINSNVDISNLFDKKTDTVYTIPATSFNADVGYVPVAVDVPDFTGSDYDYSTTATGTAAIKEISLRINKPIRTESYPADGVIKYECNGWEETTERRLLGTAGGLANWSIENTEADDYVRIVNKNAYGNLVPITADRKVRVTFVEDTANYDSNSNIIGLNNIFNVKQHYYNTSTLNIEIELSADTSENALNGYRPSIVPIEYFYNIKVNNFTGYKNKDAESNEGSTIIYYPAFIKPKGDNTSIDDVQALTDGVYKPLSNITGSDLSDGILQFSLNINNVEENGDPSKITLTKENFKVKRLVKQQVKHGDEFAIEETSNDVTNAVLFNEGDSDGNTTIEIDGIQNDKDREDASITNVSFYQSYVFNAPTPFDLKVVNKGSSQKIVWTAGWSSTADDVSKGLNVFYIYAKLEGNATDVGSNEYEYEIISDEYKENNILNNSAITTSLNNMAGYGEDPWKYVSNNSAWGVIQNGCPIEITQKPVLSIPNNVSIQIDKDCEKDYTTTFKWIYDSDPTNPKWGLNCNINSTNSTVYDNSIDHLVIAKECLVKYISQGYVKSTEYYHFSNESDIRTTVNNTYIALQTIASPVDFKRGTYAVDVVAKPNTISLDYEIGKLSEYGLCTKNDISGQTFLTYYKDGDKDQPTRYDEDKKSQYISFSGKSTKEGITYYNEGSATILLQKDAKTVSDELYAYDYNENTFLNKITLENQLFIVENHDAFYSGNSAYTISIKDNVYYNTAIKIALESCNAGKYRLVEVDNKRVYTVLDNETHVVALKAYLENDNKTLRVHDENADRDICSTEIEGKFPDEYKKEYFSTVSSDIVEGEQNEYKFFFTRKRYTVNIDYNFLTDGFYLTGSRTREFTWSSKNLEHYPEFRVADDSDDTQRGKYKLVMLAGTPIVPNIKIARHSADGKYYTVDDQDAISPTTGVKNPFFYLPNAPYYMGADTGAFTNSVYLGDSESGNTWKNSYIGCRGKSYTEGDNRTQFCLQGHGRIFERWVKTINGVSSTLAFVADSNGGQFLVENDMDLVAEVSYPTYNAYVYFALSDVTHAGDYDYYDKDNRPVINHTGDNLLEDDIEDVALASRKIPFTFETGIKFPTSVELKGYTIDSDVYSDETFLDKLTLENATRVLPETRFGPNKNGIYSENDIDFNYFIRCTPSGYVITIYNKDGSPYEISDAKCDVDVTIPDTFDMAKDGYTFAGWIRQTELPVDNAADKILYMYDSSEFMKHSIYMPAQTYKNLFDYSEDGQCNGYSLIPAYLCSNVTACFNFDAGLVVADNNYTSVTRDSLSLNYAMGSLTNAALTNPNRLAASTYKPGYHIEKDENDQIIWYKYNDETLELTGDTITSADISNLSACDVNSYWRIKWLPNTYTVTYYKDDTQLKTVNHTHEAPFFLLDEFGEQQPTKENHSFIGWGFKNAENNTLKFTYYKGASVQNLITSNNGEIVNINLYAIFVPNIAHIDGMPFRNGDHYFDVADGIILKCKKDENSPTVAWEYAGLISQTN